MISRSTLTFAATVAGLLFLLWLGSDMFLKPMMSPKLPRIPDLPPAAAPGSSVDSNLVASTLKLIDRVKKIDSDTSLEQVQVIRNPFLAPDEKSPMTVSAQNRGGGTKEFQAAVSMILIGQHRRMAVIGNQLVSEGDLYQGRRVLGIRKKSVVLDTENGPMTFSVAEWGPETVATEYLSTKSVSTNKSPSISAAKQKEIIDTVIKQIAPLLTEEQ